MHQHVRLLDVAEAGERQTVILQHISYYRFNSGLDGIPIPILPLTNGLHDYIKPKAIYGSPVRCII